MPVVILADVGPCVSRPGQDDVPGARCWVIDPFQCSLAHSSILGTWTLRGAMAVLHLVAGAPYTGLGRDLSSQVSQERDCLDTT